MLLEKQKNTNLCILQDERVSLYILIGNAHV